jgi:hypothetical protein
MGPTIRPIPIIRKKHCRLAREYPSLPPLDHDHVYVKPEPEENSNLPCMYRTI